MVKIPDNAKKVFRGVLFDVYQWEQEQFDGSFKTFEIVKRAPSVQIIAITKEREIILLKEEQPYVGDFISLPGGMIDSDEDSRDAAVRELQEETGCVGDSIELYEKVDFGSKIMWDTYYYIIRNCEKKTDCNLDLGEKLEMYLVDFEQFLTEVQKNQFRNKGFSNMMFKLMHDEKKLSEFKQKLFEN